jgi:hypothetical protein
MYAGGIATVLHGQRARCGGRTADAVKRHDHGRV